MSENGTSVTSSMPRGAMLSLGDGERMNSCSVPLSKGRLFLVSELVKGTMPKLPAIKLGVDGVYYKLLYLFGG